MRTHFWRRVYLAGSCCSQRRDGARCLAFGTNGGYVSVSLVQTTGLDLGWAQSTRYLHALATIAYPPAIYGLDGALLDTENGRGRAYEGREEGGGNDPKLFEMKRLILWKIVRACWQETASEPISATTSVLLSVAGLFFLAKGGDPYSDMCSNGLQTVILLRTQAQQNVSKSLGATTYTHNRQSPPTTRFKEKKKTAAGAQQSPR